MNISREEFNNYFQEGQTVLLEVLAQNQDISPEKFFKIAMFLENFNLYSGLIFSLIESGNARSVEEEE